MFFSLRWKQTSVNETLEQVSERSLEVVSWSKREVLFPVVEAEEMRKRWKSVEQAAGPSPAPMML